MNISATIDAEDAMLSRLTDLGYRFTRPLVTPKSYCESPTATRLRKGIVLDTETTGLDPLADDIIELGMVVFEYSPDTGQLYRVLEVFNQLEDPVKPIPPESTKIHGITDDMVRGKKIDDDKVAALLADASLVIAHNARFDRPFVESRLPAFARLPWACSFAQLPWKEEGISSASLEFLAYRYGFHFDGHRASNDCLALLEILSGALPDTGRKVMKALLESARATDLNVSALNSPFESKDVLKARGYRWNPEQKVWSGVVAEADLQRERAWLKEVVYGGRAGRLEVEKVDAYTRFSIRRGSVELQSC
ncbi:MAG: DNA polymerase III subunit epsilon [Rhodocyclaceae bacterium]|nr:MAG: DNA polymerase III subunit epsilon [Rhodocyclaceae bacterium]